MLLIKLERINWSKSGHVCVCACACAIESETLIEIEYVCVYVRYWFFFLRRKSQNGWDDFSAETWFLGILIRGKSIIWIEFWTWFIFFLNFEQAILREKKGHFCVWRNFHTIDRNLISEISASIYFSISVAWYANRVCYRCCYYCSCCYYFILFFNLFCLIKSIRDGMAFKKKTITSAQPIM